MKALITVGGGLGDVVMATPTVAAVRSMGYICDVLIKPDIAISSVIFEGWNAVRHVFTTRTPSEGSKYDAVVRTWWHQDFKLDCGPEFVPGKHDLTIEHESEACLASARALGFIGDIPSTHVQVPGCTLDMPENFVALCPGFSGKSGRSFWDRKRWDYWEEFVSHHPDTWFVILGSPVDYRDYGNLKSNNCINMTGLTTLGDAISIISKANFVVAVDNGLSHIAAALDKYTFVLYGATSEFKNRPLGSRAIIITSSVSCRPCQMTPAWNKCREYDCMRLLSPKHVWEEIEAEGILENAR